MSAGPLPGPQPLGRRRSRRFLSLSQTKLVLSGIADSRTLEAISLALGEYDRRLVSRTLSQSEPAVFFATQTDSEGIAYSTHRQRVLSLGVDRGRFPWLTEDREPTDAERQAAVIATAALLAQRSVMTNRANESKEEQEEAV